MRMMSVSLIPVVALAPIAYAADGKGQTAIGKKMNLRDLGSPEVQKQTDKELYDWTADGKGKMPGYKTKLSTDDIKALVAHMRASKK